MNPYKSFVESVKCGVDDARGVSVSGVKALSLSDDHVLLFSPHPDDECIYGALPLRLLREVGMAVTNIPVTFGSNKERQVARSKELDDACAYLGWGNYREQDGLQSMGCAEVVSVLSKYEPKVIFFPHDDDWNARHISTHHLLMGALKEMPAGFCCTVVETEFWGAMDDPNLMVEADVEVLSDLVAATSLHVGEVARNPYHLLLPAWMQDNVRRGGELVGGQGGGVPDFSFATLYRIRRWQDGALESVCDSGLFVPAGAEALKEVYSWRS